MQQKESVGIRGFLTITVKNADGDTIDVRRVKNLVVTQGLEMVTERFVDGSAGAVNYMWVSERSVTPSSGSTIANSMATSGGSELLPAAPASAVRTSNEIVYTSQFDFADSYGIQSAALSTTNVSGTTPTFSITGFPIINVTNGDSVTVNWSITIT